jgi:hypothetical protein
MHWNHRIVKVGEGEDTCYMFAEVFYDDESKKPTGWTEAAIVGNSLDDMKWAVEKLAEALTHPVLNASELDDYNEEEEE